MFVYASVCSAKENRLYSVQHTSESSSWGFGHTYSHFFSWKKAIALKGIQSVCRQVKQSFEELGSQCLLRHCKWQEVTSVRLGGSCRTWPLVLLESSHPVRMSHPLRSSRAVLYRKKRICTSFHLHCARFHLRTSSFPSLIMKHPYKLPHNESSTKPPGSLTDITATGCWF